MEIVQRRLVLQAHLEQVSGLPESKVHFQPPTGKLMTYPAITYSRSRAKILFADNLPYFGANGYTVTVIDKDPDGVIRSKIAALPYCEFDRWYATDGLNHDVFNLFF